MAAGYLTIETHSDHPAVVRLRVTERRPEPEHAAAHTAQVRYISRFNDPLTATMHLHEILRRRLIDPDEHMYRTDFITAIAALESIDLRHERIYLDPLLDDETCAEITRQTEEFVARRQRRDKVFQAMGFVGIAILLFNLFFFSLS
ncbi:MAG: hypothetical protein KDI82_11265 [Gammaproteobacteria bacterium]|nr:hypothetical protein [Gammaproteobacteria bacterium]